MYTSFSPDFCFWEQDWSLWEFSERLESRLSPLSCENPEVWKFQIRREHLASLPSQCFQIMGSQGPLAFQKNPGDKSSQLFILLKAWKQSTIGHLSRFYKRKDFLTTAASSKTPVITQQRMKLKLKTFSSNKISELPWPGYSHCDTDQWSLCCRPAWPLIGQRSATVSQWFTALAAYWNHQGCF